jgi:succinate-semialdehyde dehydrogenase/glutarate-semialdehyde dehydrogenase
MYGYRKLYIDGELVDASSGERKKVISPASEEVIGEVAWAGRVDAERALAAAQKGYETWRATSIGERNRAIERLRKLVLEAEETLRECVMHEHGKTYEQAEEDWFTLADALEFYPAEMRSKSGEVIPDLTGNFSHQFCWEPAGVVGAFLAWNFPLLNLAFKLGPSLAAGCSIIIRPSTETPISTCIVGELCHEAGIPAGVVNVLPGSVGEVANTIVESPIPALLTLIGSTATGRQIMERGSSSIKRYSMELGGNAPVIVCEDADVDLAANTVTMLKFANTGQICVTPNRVYVHHSHYDRFLEVATERARAQVVTHGRDSGATMGPLSTAAARDRVADWVQQAIEGGARCLHGGSLEGMPAKGFYYPPTILADVADDMIVSCDEVFGPVVSVAPYSDEAEALSRANDTTAGLTAFIFGSDITRLNRLARELRFGEVQVNGVRYGVGLPHGGIKQSGMGHDASSHALDDYLIRKRVTVAL